MEVFYINTIGERIRYLRNLNGTTLKFLSDATKISKGNLSSYENNKFNPGAEALVLISNFFNVSTDYLLTGKDFSPCLSTEENLFDISNEEYKLIKLFRKLNHVDKIKIEGIIENKLYEYNK